MKVVTFGTGQLGKDLHEVFTDRDWDTHSFTKLGCDITNHEQTRALLHTEKPDLVINCAAIHDLPTCEKDPASSSLVNVYGAARLAMQTNNVCPIVYISTDQVFDGALGRPYTESDPKHPLNIYAKHKSVGENVVCAFNPRHYIIRTGCLYGGSGPRQKGGNFVTKLLARTGNVTMTIRGKICSTWTHDLANAIESLVSQDSPFGIYHLTNRGSCSWFELAQEIIIQSGRTDITLIPTDEDPSGVKRSGYSVLDTSKAASCGITLADWRDGLDGYLEELRDLRPELFQR